MRESELIFSWRIDEHYRESHMDSKKEVELIGRARNDAFTESELVTFYENVSNRG